MKAPTVAKNTFYLYVMTAAKFVLPLIITAWLTRRLGPDSYGVISYLTPVMGYFTLLFDFGFNFSATKKISQHKDDKQLIEKTISAVYTAKLLLTLVGVLLLAAMSLFVEIIREHLLLTILYYISTAAQIFIPDFLYRGLEKMEGVTTRYIIAKLVSAVLILVTVRNDDVLLLVPVAYLTGTVVAAVYTNRHMVRGLGFRMSLSGIGEAIAELKEATVYFVSTFASTALSVTSTFVMGVVGMEPAQIAYWSVAFQVIQAVQAMYDPITTSVYPHVAEKKNHRLVLRLTAYLLPRGGGRLRCVVLAGKYGGDRYRRQRVSRGGAGASNPYPRVVFLIYRADVRVPSAGGNGQGTADIVVDPRGRRHTDSRARPTGTDGYVYIVITRNTEEYHRIHTCGAEDILCMHTPERAQTHGGKLR